MNSLHLQFEFGLAISAVDALPDELFYFFSHFGVEEDHDDEENELYDVGKIVDRCKEGHVGSGGHPLAGRIEHYFRSDLQSFNNRHADSESSEEQILLNFPANQGRNGWHVHFEVAIGIDWKAYEEAGDANFKHQELYLIGSPDLSWLAEPNLAEAHPLELPEYAYDDCCRD